MLEGVQVIAKQCMHLDQVDHVRALDSINAKALQTSDQSFW